MITAYLKMNRFIGAELEKREVFGKTRECISIPLDLNGILIKKKSLLLRLMFIAMKPNKNNMSHYLKILYNDINMKKYICDLGYENDVRYIGNVFVSSDTNMPTPENAPEDLDKILGINNI